MCAIISARYLYLYSRNCPVHSICARYKLTLAEREFEILCYDKREKKMSIEFAIHFIVHFYKSFDIVPIVAG